MIRNIRNNGGIMLSVEGERKGKDGRAGASVSFLKDFDPAEASAHLTRDAALLTRLHDYDIDRAMSSPGRSVRHPDMLPYVEEPHTRETIAVLRKRLKTVGTFGVFMNKDHSVLVDGKPQKITIVKATPAEANGDMDGMVWVRDQNEVVKTKLKKLRFGTERNQREEEETRELLLSTMHLMSTTSGQIEDRFRAIIVDNTLADKYLAWPQIAMKIDEEHLEGEVGTKWRHTQEAFQKLALSVFDAFDLGLIIADQLSEGNKQFLASLMPFLAAVNFTKRPSSGPWEEQMAVRTSVIGVETALLHKVRKYAGKEGFEFLEQGYNETKEHLLHPKKETSLSTETFAQEPTFDQALERMIKKGLETLGQKIPFEAPDDTGIRKRHADIALLDLLDYGIPELLAKNEIAIKIAGNKPLESIAIEDLILKEVGKLYDQQIHAFFRYGAEEDADDTYLKGNYATDHTQWQITMLKRYLDTQAGGGEIDLDKKAELRAEITSGKSAAWVHPDFQIAAWADEMIEKIVRQAEEAGRTVDKQEIMRYHTISEAMINIGLSALTGPNEHRSLLNGDGTHHVQSVEELQVPECWITMVTPEGDEFTVASPNTPLTWGATEADRALFLHETALATQEQLRLAV